MIKIKESVEKYWVCTTCDFIYPGEQPPTKCPKCGQISKKVKYMKIGEDKKRVKDVLFSLLDLLEKNGFTTCLFGGALLGIIRNNDFIDYDGDLDIFVIGEHFYKRDILLRLKADLEQNNLRIRYNYRNLVLGIEHKVETDTTVSLLETDIISLIKKEDFYCHENSVGRHKFPHYFFDELDTIEFLGRKCNVPHNPEEFLTYQYGDNWRTPIPNEKGKLNHVDQNHQELKETE